MLQSSSGPWQRTGVVGEGGLAHPDDTCGRALQPRRRTGSPWLLDRSDEEAGREEQSSGRIFSQIGGKKLLAEKTFILVCLFLHETNVSFSKTYS